MLGGVGADLNSLQFSVGQPKLIFQNEGDLPLCNLLSAYLLHLGIFLVRVHDNGIIVEDLDGSVFDSLVGSLLIHLDKF